MIAKLRKKQLTIGNFGTQNYNNIAVTGNTILDILEL